MNFKPQNKTSNKQVKNVSRKHRLNFEYFSGKGHIFSSAHVCAIKIAD